MSRFGDPEEKMPASGPELFKLNSLRLMREESGGDWGGGDDGWDQLDFVKEGADLRDATVSDAVKVSSVWACVVSVLGAVRLQCVECESEEPRT